jgi:hypothetical protein
MTTTIITDALWEEIATAPGIPSRGGQPRSKSRLPDEARDQIETAIRVCRDEEERKYEVHSGPAKGAVSKARKRVEDLSRILAPLEMDQGYRHFNTDGELVDASELRKLCDQLLTRLTTDDKRLSRQSRRNWNWFKNATLARRLLEIRAAHLQTELLSGDFERYVRLCMGLANVSEEDITRAISNATGESAKKARKRPPRETNPPG